jgi:hypothetical protein
MFHDKISAEMRKNRGMVLGKKDVPEGQQKKEPFQQTHPADLFPFRLYRFRILKGILLMIILIHIFQIV